MKKKRELLAIHVIEKGKDFSNLHRVDAERDIWESGNWYVADRYANALVGKMFYLHPGQKRPAEVGGLIESWSHAKNTNRKIFRFKRHASAEGKVTSSLGWGNDRKYDWGTDNTFGTLPFDRKQLALLNSLMPGGDNWARKGACLTDCPFYSCCKGHGPQDLCSSNWRAAEMLPLTVNVFRHIITNLDHYNAGDFPLEDPEQSKKGFLKLLDDCLARLLNDEREIDCSETISEGDQRLVTHLIRERSSSESKRLKWERMKEGALVCEACGVDYLACFGEAATRVIECHHTVPLASDVHGGTTNIRDLVLLCANCHRLAHSRKEPYAVEELKEILAGSAQSQ